MSARCAFDGTGAPQTFTVPPGVSSLSVVVDGAEGGVNLVYVGSGGLAGAFGGEESGSVAVTPGQKLTIVAGQAGVDPIVSPFTNAGPSYGGGGAGGTAAGSGGGGSFVFGPSGQLLLAAGGGGGQANDACGGSGGTGGGTAGAKPGLNGCMDLTFTTQQGLGGGAASAGGGGSGGAPGSITGCGNIGTIGHTGGGPASSATSFGVGGNGGIAANANTLCTAPGGGGGGGGGYYGGGGGGGGYYGGGGGGGGSGFAAASVSNANSALAQFPRGGFVTINFATCAAQNVALNTVEYGADHPNGARINTPVTLIGKGFCPGMSVQFGNELAVVDPPDSAISSDGTSVQVTVPRLATTGTLSITSGAKQASLQGTFDVDSFRDADAFGFRNFGGIPSLTDFEQAFGLDRTTRTVIVYTCGPKHCPKTVHKDLPATLNAYFNLRSHFGHGVCWGWDLEAQRLSAGGDTPLVSVDPSAKDPWQLTLTPSLEDMITTAHWLQYSDQIENMSDHDRTIRKAAALLGEVTSALRGGVETGSNGAIIDIFYKQGDGWHGHALLAYDVEPQPNGGFNIDVADPNAPFTPAENATDGSAHQSAVTGSTIMVGPAGTWSFAGFGGVSGSSQTLAVEPYPSLISAIHGGVTFTDPGPNFQRTIVDAGTVLDSLIDPAGQAVDTSDPSDASGVLFEPTLDEDAPGSYSFDGPEGTYLQDISGSSPGELVEVDGLQASIDASAGSDAVAFDPQTQTVSLNGTPGAAVDASAGSRSGQARAYVASTSRSASVSLSDAGARTVTVSGPAAGLRLSFGRSRSTIQLGGDGGGYTVTLGDGGQASEFDLTLSGHQTASISPDWPSLASAAVVVALRSASGHLRTMRLGNRLHPARTPISSLAASGRVVRLSIALPSATTATKVELYLTVTKGGRVLAQTVAAFVPQGRARRTSIKIRLHTAPPAGSAIVAYTVTQSAGPFPVLGTSQLVVHTR